MHERESGGEGSSQPGAECSEATCCAEPKRTSGATMRISCLALVCCVVGGCKVEAWGDGKSNAETLSYTATSYVFILGGWHNMISVIARLDEHGNDRRPRM